MNVLDNHITDLDKRINDICKTAPNVEEASIQESLSSYGWILLDSWIAWRTLRFLLKDQYISNEIQKKWFQTPSSFSASQIRAVWHFGNNLDLYLNEKYMHNLKFIIDDEIEKNRNMSAHFSTNGTINGNDYQKIESYHATFSNIFLLYEILSFYMSISNIALKVEKTILRFLNNDEEVIFEYTKSNQYIDYNIDVVDLSDVSIIEINFNSHDKEGRLCFDKDGCYIIDDEIKIGIGDYRIFSNKGYYRDLSAMIEKLQELGY